MDVTIKLKNMLFIISTKMKGVLGWCTSVKIFSVFSLSFGASKNKYRSNSV